MDQQQTNATGSRILRGIAAFFAFLLRLIFVIVLAILLGIGLYYGVPWAYRALVQPIQDNAARITALEQRVEQEQVRLREENRLLQERVAALEAAITELREETTLHAQAQQEAEERIQDVEDRAARMGSALETLQQDLQEMRGSLESTVAEMDQWSESSQERLADLEGRLALLQMAQELLKARLFLLEDNLTGARDVIRLAAGHLDRAIILMPAQTDMLMDLQERLIGMDALIVNRSFRTLPELESVWAALIEVAVPPPLQPTPTPLPALTPTPTPAP